MDSDIIEAIGKIRDCFESQKKLNEALIDEITKVRARIKVLEDEKHLKPVDDTFVLF